MRQVAVVALLGALVAGCVGGLTPEQQSRIDALMVKVEALANANATLGQRFAAGTLTVDEFKTQMEANVTTIRAARDEIGEIRTEAGTKAVLAGALGGVTGRTMLHGGAVFASKFLPPQFAWIGTLLSMVLGGSASAKKKEDEAKEAPKA